MHLEKEFLLPGKVYGSTFPQVNMFLWQYHFYPHFHLVNESISKSTNISASMSLSTTIFPASNGVVRDARRVRHLLKLDFARGTDNC